MSSPARRSDEPGVIVLMGVAGSGKTTVGQLLAARLGWTFLDADWLHPEANVRKMRSGLPLTDEDRWPWLNAIAERIDTLRNEGSRVVVACSALRRAYRNVLVDGHGDVRLAYLEGAAATLHERLRGRDGHFMPASLLDSQFAALEAPTPDECPIIVSIEIPPAQIVAAIAARFA
jgi:carbohydrate kinase (thermoresistant glucokinase family)